MILPENLNKYKGVVAFFTDRTEGVEPSRISTLSGIDINNILYLKQEHSDKIITIHNNGGESPLIGDGMVTDRMGLLLSVKVADCVPVLMYDFKRNVIGSVHAGWRGTAKGIIKKAIKVFVDRYGSLRDEILIAMGPSIRWCCYFVDEGVLNLLKEQTGEGEYFLFRDGKICLDLPTANMYQALSEGVPEENIWISEECTFCYPERYFSYRYDRTTKRQGGFIGIRQI